MKKHPLDIPEILELIREFVPGKNFVSCILVCKNFYHAFLPGIWHYLAPSATKDYHGSPGFRQGLERNKDHIVVLNLERQFSREDLSLRGCSQLQHLCVQLTDRNRRYDIKSGRAKAEDEDEEAYQLRALSQISDLIAAHSSTLRNVSLEISFRGRPAKPRKLWTALQQCLVLEELVLLFIVVGDDDIEDFFRACARSQVLSLRNITIREKPAWFDHLDGTGSEFIPSFTRNFSSSDKHPGSNHGINDDFLFKRLKTLRMHLFRNSASYPALSGSDQAAFVRRCFNLKDLQWSNAEDEYRSRRPAVGAERKWKEAENRAVFYQALSMDPWTLPELESIYLAEGDLVNDRDLAAVMGQMHQLNNLQALRTLFGPLSFQALIETGAGRLSLSIKILNLGLCDSVTSAMVQTIMASCPALVDFRARTVTITDIARGRDWICTGLTNLTVYVEADVDFNTEAGRALHRAVHGQLGRLKKLRRLSLMSSVSTTERGTLDLRLIAGLDRLTGLKDLIELSYRGRESEMMGADEAAWILENWPHMGRMALRIMSSL